MEDRFSSWQASERSQNAWALMPFLTSASASFRLFVAIITERWMPIVLLPSVWLMWGLSLPFLSLNPQSDLGLLTALPSTFFMALVVLLLSFSLVVFYRPYHTSALFMHVLTLVLILHGTPALVYSNTSSKMASALLDRGAVLYLSQAPQAAADGSASFSALVGLFLEASKMDDLAEVMKWAPLVFTLLISGALYLTFSSLTEDARLVWSTIWFFNLTCWPLMKTGDAGTFGFFIYAAIIGILMRWFQCQAPVQLITSRMDACFDEDKNFNYRRPAIHDATNYFFRSELPPAEWLFLLPLIILLMLALVFTHNFYTTALVITLVLLALFNRVAPKSLIWSAALFSAVGVVVGVSGNLNSVSFISWDQYQAGRSTFVSVFLATGGSGQAFVKLVGYALMAMVAMLAVEGFVWRLIHRCFNLSVVLLGASALPLFFTALIDGNNIFLSYILALPVFAFFIASLFYVRPLAGRKIFTPFFMTLLSMILLGGMLISHFGGITDI